jgi:precorrin-6A/cobalt-precorrin-6A reductase
MTIWLIGGTQESAVLAQAIAAHQLPCIVTATTDSARSLYPISPTLKVWIGRLNAEHLAEFIQTHHIHCILDASHPFAVDISQLAIALAQTQKLPYLRYERPPVPSAFCSNEGAPSEPSSSPVLYLPDFPSLFSGNYLIEQRVLLTIGYRPLHFFSSWHDRATLFARILPSTIALQAAQSAGFTNDRLIALRPPVSAALEAALWQQWQISIVVTKASGTAGGEDTKQAVAQTLGITLVVIDRPSIDYPDQTSDIPTALSFCLHAAAISTIPIP